MNAPPAEKKPGWFARLLAIPGQLTLSAWAALLTALILVMTVIVVWVWFYSSQHNVHVALTPLRMALVLAFVITIPLVVYGGLRLWLEGEPSQFPDIDHAWKAGITALQNNGLSLNSAPVFMILGSTVAQERSLLRATGWNLRIDGVPNEPAPLHWYATPEAIFIFCSEAGWLGALAQLSSKQSFVTESYEGTTSNYSPSYSAPTPAAANPTPPPQAPEPAQGGGDAIQGTVMLDQFLGDTSKQSSPRTAHADTARSGTSNVQRTITGSSTASVNDFRAAQAAVQANVSATMSSSGFVDTTQERVAVILSAQESSRQLRRLQYVCQLLRNTRGALCALNGVLTLVPFDTVVASPAEIEEMERAIRTDLLTIQREIKLRCPVTALVVGLEKDRGFRELVRRVGPARAAGQRFGRKYDVRSEATSEELTALCAHVCGAFEDWVYMLFQEQNALTRPGNSHLYGLLCRVRCHLKDRLAGILSSGYGYDRRDFENNESFLFSGCYFAATGETTDRQAFVKGVLEKLVEEQEFIEWTRVGMATDLRYRLLSYAGWAVSGVLIVLLVGMIAFSR